MLDVRVRGYVDLKEILEFYKSELESENKLYISEAIRRYNIVSKVVGKENSEFCLLPLILKVLEVGNYEINHIISEELPNIIDVNLQYSEESKQIIKEICSCLLFNEELNIRMESIKSLELIFSHFNSETLITLFIDEILLPIVKVKCYCSENEYSAINSSLTDKLSLCNIIPTLILPYCDKIEKNNLFLLYLSLCDDEVPSLRISASQNLVSILKKIFPLKFGMNIIEYQSFKLQNQSLITEKLLNLVLSLYKDQISCNILKSASVGIAIQLYINPIFYLEYISNEDRDNLLYYICNFLDNRLYSQRQAVIGELIPICLSIQGYYELEQNDKIDHSFQGYILNNTKNILDNIMINNRKVDIIQCVFNIIRKEGDVEIKVLALNFFEKLVLMGIEIYEEIEYLPLNKAMEIRKKKAINKVLISIIIYINDNISDLLSENHISFKSSFCILSVQVIKYIQYLLNEQNVNIDYNIKERESELEYSCVKDSFVQVFISYFKDPNINVIIAAINYLYMIINQLDEENLANHILPRIKSLVFDDSETITHSNGNSEKTITLQKWRIKRCIIRQIPLWTKHIIFNNKVCPFFNSIIIRCILDPAISVNICSLQTIMRIISEFVTLDECIKWIDDFVIPFILIPYIENKTSFLEFTYNASIHSNLQGGNHKESVFRENKEKYEYAIRNNDHTMRIFVTYLIFALYRSLFYKWVYVNFSSLKEYLNAQEAKHVESMQRTQDESKGPYGVLSDILNEEIFVKLSKLVIPIIYNSIQDSVINVSIATSQLVLQIVKLFSLNSYILWERDMFKNSSFGEKDEFVLIYDDELLKGHLMSQFEHDSIWHLRSIMSNYEIPHQKIHHFPNCIYKEFVSVFDKYNDLEIQESEPELFHSVNSIKSWYSHFNNKIF